MTIESGTPGPPTKDYGTPGGFFEWLVSQEPWAGMTIEEAQQNWEFLLTTDQKDELLSNFEDWQNRPVSQKITESATITLADGTTVPANWQLVGSYLDEEGKRQEIYVPILSLDDFDIGNFNTVIKNLYGEQYTELLQNVNMSRLLEPAAYASIASETNESFGIDSGRINDNVAVKEFVINWARNLASPSLEFDEMTNFDRLELIREMDMLIPSLSQLSGAGIDVNSLMTGGTIKEQQLGHYIMSTLSSIGREMSNPAFMAAHPGRINSRLTQMVKAVGRYDVGAAFAVADTLFGETARRRSALAVLGFSLQAPDIGAVPDFLIDWNKINAWVAEKPTRQRFIDEAISRAQAIVQRTRETYRGIEPREGIAMRVNRVFAQNFIYELEKAMGFRAETGEIDFTKETEIGKLRRAIGGGQPRGPRARALQAEREAREEARKAEEAAYKELQERAITKSLEPRRIVRI